MCLQLGIDDPEMWLATKPKRVVALWEAYWRLEPWGLPWHRAAGSVMKLDQILEVILSWATGGKSKYKARQFKHWMPGDWADSSERPEKRMTLKEQLDIVAKAYSK